VEKCFQYLHPTHVLAHNCLRSLFALNLFRRRRFPRAGFTIEEIFNLAKIDRWFLTQIKEIVDFEEELATGKN
jgi:hypothetical protein